MKKFIFFLITGLVYLQTLSAKVKEDTLLFVLKFNPSFYIKSELTIYRSETTYLCNFKIFDLNKDTVCHSEKTVAISDSIMHQLYFHFRDCYIPANTNQDVQFVDNGDTFSYKMKEYEGVTVYGKLLKNHQKIKYIFRSPEKGTEDYFFSEMIFGFLNSSFIHESEITQYIETLESYFEFGLGLKQLSNKPLKYKLYGNITTKNEKDLIRFLESLPTNIKVNLDLSNLFSIDQSLLSLLKKYIYQNPNIYFENPNHRALVELNRMGVREENIISKQKLIRVIEENGHPSYKFVDRQEKSSL